MKLPAEWMRLCRAGFLSRRNLKEECDYVDPIYGISGCAADSARAGPCFADMAAAKKWVDSEFQPSLLSKDEQLKEMEWFINAANPFTGMEINVLSEGVPTHTMNRRS